MYFAIVIPSLVVLMVGSQLLPLDQTDICSITLEDQPCSILPIFDGCHQEYDSLSLNLVRYYFASDRADKTSLRLATIKLIIDRRSRLQLVYNQELRFVRLYLTVGQCCNHPEVTFVIEYIRQNTNPCPTLQADTSDSTLACLPLFLGLFNVIIFNNLVLIRGQGYGLLLTVIRINPYSFDEDQFLWVERMLEFGMWIGYDIQKGAPPESCNCSTMEPLKPWYKDCAMAYQVPDNGTLPVFWFKNYTEKSIPEDRDGMNLADVEKWVIFGIVCFVIVMIGLFYIATHIK